MATLYTLRSGATQHPEAMMGFLASRLVTVAGTFDKDSDHFKCEQQSTPDMTVKVNDGYALIPLSDLSFVHPVELDGGDGSVTIGANSSGNDRIDAIVLYIDRSASANTTATNVATLYVVEGTPAGSPVAPTDNEIQTEIGASNPFIRLADVTVENGTSDITDSDITDQRVDATYSTKVVSDWKRASGTWTYSAWDDTNGVSTATITVPTGAASIYQVGMRIKFDQTTDGTKYGIITKVADTELTAFINTDYDFDNETISNAYYSASKAPLGFDGDPTKWTVELKDTTARTQTSPVQNTWYNLGSLSLDVPVGAWEIEWSGMMTNDTLNKSIEVTLSTANNSESDTDYTIGIYYPPANLTLLRIFARHYFNLSTKDTYYINARSITASSGTLRFSNHETPMIFRAICSYL